MRAANFDLSLWRTNVAICFWCAKFGKGISIFFIADRFNVFCATPKTMLSICFCTSDDNIESKDLYEIPVMIASREDQEQFAAFVRQSDKSKFELEKALSELTATYKRILAENLG